MEMTVSTVLQAIYFGDVRTSTLSNVIAIASLYVLQCLLMGKVTSKVEPVQRMSMPSSHFLEVTL